MSLDHETVAWAAKLAGLRGNLNFFEKHLEIEKYKCPQSVVIPYMESEISKVKKELEIHIELQPK